MCRQQPPGPLLKVKADLARHPAELSYVVLSGLLHFNVLNKWLPQYQCFPGFDKFLLALKMRSAFCL